MKRLRSTRGWDRVAAALGLQGECDEQAVIDACLVGAPEIELVVADRPSRVRPGARGRYAAGRVTLFPRAFADPWVLSHTLLHEVAHARGADEREAETFALEVLQEFRRPEVEDSEFRIAHA